MTFLNMSWAWLILVGGALILWYSIRYDTKYYNWVNKYWFKERSLSSKIKTLFFSLGLLSLFVALLDVRGPEEVIQAETPDQKTVIVVDTSASMLVEDVKPNRIRRGLFLARHFIRNAVGHHISIVIFSDYAKRIVPFTDDTDILVARLMTVEGMNMESGGTNITLALMQAIQYLERESQHAGRVLGNILLITDGEEHDWRVDSLEIPDGITIASIGVGTRRGGRIPLRSREGSFRGYKSFQGEEIVSTLEEDYFKSLSSRTRNHRYWIAHSFNIPTDEVIEYFNDSFENILSETEIRVRPVLGYPIIMIGMILLALASICSLMKSYKKILVCVFLLFIISLDENKISAQEIELSSRSLSLIERLKEGRISKEERIELAENLMKSDEHQLANRIYQELIEDYGLENLGREDQINYATSELFGGEISKGLDMLRSIDQELEREGENREKRQAIMNNILRAIQQQEQQQEQQEQDGDSQDDGDDQDDQEQSEEGDGDSSDREDEQSEDQQDQSDNESDGSEEDDDQRDDHDEDDSDSDDQQDQADQPDSRELPALIDQIMNEDRRLQQEQLDTSTRDQRRGRESKDW